MAQVSTLKTLPHMVHDLVERDPDRELMRFRRASTRETTAALTYGDLWAQASGFAATLSEIASRPRVMIVLPLGPRLLAAHFGTMLAGGVPSIYSHPSEKIARAVYLRNLEHVVELLHPDVIVTNPSFAEDLAGRARIIVEGDVPFQGEMPTAWKEVLPSDIALIQHSSGSTGLQKGVCLTHAMIAEQCASYAHRLELDGTRDRIASWLPLYHDMGLFTTWLMPLLHGIPVEALDPFEWIQNSSAILHVLAETRGTLCWQPNFAYRVLAQRVGDEELGSLDLSAVRGFVNCSEPVRYDCQQAFLQRFERCGVTASQLWVCYAMAEASFAVTQSGLATSPPRVLSCSREELSRGAVAASDGDGTTMLVSCGRPIEGCEVRVVSADRQPLDPGAVGEVSIRGSYVLSEYYRNEEATRAAIAEDGWYHTGDLGFLWEGELFITGRKKDLLIVGGRNFYPQDLEAIANECEGVERGRCVAIGLEDGRTGTERVIVMAETRLARDAWSRIGGQIRQAISEQLDCPVSEVHMVPHQWLLKTSSGKIARQPNLQRYLESEFSTPVGAQPGPWWETLLWAFAAGVGLLVLQAMQANASWGVYAHF